MLKLGTAISTVATPIARVFHMDCIDRDTNQLRPDSGCAKMRDNLNSGMSLADAVIARWFSDKQETINGDVKMGQPYIISEQTVIHDAKSPADAITKKIAGEGEVISLAAQVRPAPPQRPQQQTGKPA